MAFDSMQLACVSVRNIATTLDENGLATAYAVVAEERLIGLAAENISTIRRHVLFEYSDEPVFHSLITEMMAIYVLWGINCTVPQEIERFLNDVKPDFPNDQYVHDMSQFGMQTLLNKVTELGCFCPDGTTCSGDSAACGNDSSDNGQGLDATIRDFPDFSDDTANEVDEKGTNDTVGQEVFSSTESDSSEEEEDDDRSDDSSNDSRDDSSDDSSSDRYENNESGSSCEDN